VNSFVHDLRFALRMIRNCPSFTVVAILTLALGIGANAAIYSFVDGVLLRPLPYPHPEQIVNVWEKPPNYDRNGISTLNFLDWKNQNTVFTAMAAQTGGSATLTGVDVPVQLRGSQVSARYFDIFGIKPVLGRTFAPNEDEPGKEQVVVLSNRIWQGRFGGDRGIIGRTIHLDNKPYTVIGVLPADDPHGRGWEDIWRPLTFQPQDMTRNFHWMMSWARLTRRAARTSAHTNEIDRSAYRARLSGVEQGLERDHRPFCRSRGGRQPAAVFAGASRGRRRRPAHRLRQFGQPAAGAGRRP